jgi:hypothetical protein
VWKRLKQSPVVPGAGENSANGVSSPGVPKAQANGFRTKGSKAILLYEVVMISRDNTIIVMDAVDGVCLTAVQVLTAGNVRDAVYLLYILHFLGAVLDFDGFGGQTRPW